jgi:hypothetical protein
MLHEMITGATAEDDIGTLALDLVGGIRLEVAPSKSFEAWGLRRMRRSQACCSTLRRSQYVGAGAVMRQLGTAPFGWLQTCDEALGDCPVRLAPDL